MERLYANDLLELLQKRQETVEMNGITVLVKNLPDSDERGVLDPRLFQNVEKRMTNGMPKDGPVRSTDPQSIMDMRVLFGGVKSIPVVESGVSVSSQSVRGVDGNDIRIRIYRPEHCGANLPVLLYFHGGGFFGGSPDVVEQLVKIIVQREQIPAVSVDYRLAPENPYPAGHNDCFSVLEWLYEHAASIGADREKIVVSGDSAGGNLACFCTIKDRNLNTHMVRGQMLLYPAVNVGGAEDDLVRWSLDKYEIAPQHRAIIERMASSMGNQKGMLGGILGASDLKSPDLTPYLADLKGLPPTLVVVGEHDGLMVECMAMAVKLNRAGVTTKTILYRGLGHAFGDYIGVYPQSEDCAIEMGKFIKESCDKTIGGRTRYENKA